MARQKRPSGVMWPVDDSWKREVVAALHAKKITRRDLALLLDVAPSAITRTEQSGRSDCNARNRGML